MQFKAEEWLVHPHYGVGRVVKLEQRRFSEEKPREYYEIEISTGTVWVPVEGPGHGLRRPTSRGELPRYRGLLKGRPTPVASDSKERKTDLVERLKGGSFAARCEVVRDLSAHAWHKPLNESTGATLRLTREVLCAEWAVAEGITMEAAATEVDALLLEGRRHFDL